MMPQTKQYKVDIFDILDNLNAKNRNYYPSLKDEEKKAIPMPVVMRWLTGTSNPRQIVFINELVNPFVFSLSKHPELIMDLMMSCTSGSKVRYRYPKLAKKKASGTPKLVQTIQEYFGYNSKHAEDALGILEDDDILDYASQLGYQKDDIKIIKKELKTRAKV